jgi:hypothetical protein
MVAHSLGRRCALPGGATALAVISRRLKRALVFRDPGLEPHNLHAVDTLGGPFDGNEWKLRWFSSIHQRTGEEEPPARPLAGVRCYYLDMSEMLTTYNNKIPHGQAVNHMLADLGYLEYDADVGKNMNVLALVHKATGCAIGNVRGKPVRGKPVRGKPVRGKKGKMLYPTTGLVIHPRGPKEDGTPVTVNDVRGFVADVNIIIRKRLCWA